MAGNALVQVVVLLAAVLGLWVGARLLVDSVVRLARGLGLSELAIGLTVVAMGTSTPELIVTADAALVGLGDIAVANVVGSNIYNLAFILGVVSLIRIVPVERSLVHRDGIVLVLTTLLLGAMLLDLTVGRPEGIALIAGFVAYTAYLLRTEADEERETTSDVTRPITERARFRGRDGAAVVVGLAIVLVSGHYMVGASSALARAGGVSEWVIGGTIVAAGTSTPEFAVSLVALRRGSIGVSVGNVVGSNILNVLAILGFAATLRPLTVAPAALRSLGWLTGIVVLMVAALWSGRQLSRPEGGVFALSELVRWALGLLGSGG